MLLNCIVNLLQLSNKTICNIHINISQRKDTSPLILLNLHQTIKLFINFYIH